MSDKAFWLDKLKRDPIANAWAIQDLTLWPEASSFVAAESDDGLSYLLVSGHPATRGLATVILGDDGDCVEKLLPRLPPKPYVIRETKAAMLEKLRPALDGAVISLRQRMDVTADQLRPRPSGNVRRLSEDDAPALAAFYGAPPPAAHGMKPWLRAATVMASFRGSEIAAIGSTVVSSPDVWILAEIITKPEFRGQGHGTAVTSALAVKALEASRLASLTVVKDNAPAIAVYSKLGFQVREDRLYIDNGVGRLSAG